MKAVFDVKKILIWTLIFIFALSLPLTVSAKPGNGNQGNRGNSGNERQEKRENKKEDQEERQQLKNQLKEAKKQQKEMSKEEQIQLIAEAEEEVDLLEAEGNIDEAFEVQTELVQLDLKDKNAYKKLGNLYDKGKGKDKKETKVFVNGSHPVFDVPPVVRDGRTLIPLRAVSNSLKAEVDWNAEEKKVTISRDDVKMELYIGESTAYINGEEISLDVPANVENSRTFVPIRFISEAFNAYVDWEEETDSVIIVDESDEEAVDEEGTEEAAVVDEETTDEAATEDSEIVEDEAATEDSEIVEDEEVVEDGEEVVQEEETVEDDEADTEVIE